MVPIVREAVCSDASGIARVHVESWQTTYRDIMPADYLANLKIEQRLMLWNDLLCAEQREQFHYVVEDEGQIVGFASGGKERSKDKDYQGELYAIYLLDSYQRKGLGRAMVRPIAERLIQAGMKSMLIWVLAENPSRGFYEAIGGQAVRSQLISIGDRTYEETAYGWLDVAGLVNNQR